MIKNETYTPVVVNNRNEMIDAIEAQHNVIYVCNDAYNEINSELKKQVRDTKPNRFLGKILCVAGPAIGIELLLIPGIGWTIGGVALFALLTGSGALFSANSGEILKSYMLAYDCFNGKSRFVLINKNYSIEHHSLSDGCIITSSNKCPKCNNKYNAKSMFCVNCHAHMIKITKKSALKRARHNNNRRSQ